MFLVRCSIAWFDWSVGRSIAYVAGLLVGWGRRVERHSGTDKQSEAYEAGFDGEKCFSFLPTSQLRRSLSGRKLQFIIDFLSLQFNIILSDLACFSAFICFQTHL